MNINGTEQHNAKKSVIALDPESQEITLLPLPDTHTAHVLVSSTTWHGLEYTDSILVRIGNRLYGPPSPLRNRFRCIIPHTKNGPRREAKLRMRGANLPLHRQSS